MDIIIAFLELVSPRIEDYREIQVNKYQREMEMDYGGDYTRMERYKNRVRVIDIFLPPLKRILVVKCGIKLKERKLTKLK